MYVYHQQKKKRKKRNRQSSCLFRETVSLLICVSIIKSHFPFPILCPFLRSVSVSHLSGLTTACSTWPFFLQADGNLSTLASLNLCNLCDWNFRAVQGKEAFKIIFAGFVKYINTNCIFVSQQWHYVCMSAVKLSHFADCYICFGLHETVDTMHICAALYCKQNSVCVCKTFADFNTWDSRQ